MLSKEEIPNRVERLVVLRLLAELLLVYRNGLIVRGLGSTVPLDVFPVAVPLYEASFYGRGMTLAALTRASKMPRATVMRRLDAVMQVGLVERRGQYYWVTDDVLKNPPADITRSLRAIQSAAEQLRHVKKL